MSPFSPGEVVSHLVVDPVEPGPMKVVAALQDDPNPIHWDVDAFSHLGLGRRAINQGPLTISYLLSLAAKVAGCDAGVRALRARFLGNVLAGDRVECSATVVAVDRGTGEAKLELRADVRGEAVAMASATISLPS